MKYTIYADESGWIKGSLVNEDDIDPISFFGPIALQEVPSDSPVSPFTHCVFNGQVIEIGPQPSPYHIVKSGAWFLPPEIELVLAKKERNTVLSTTDWMTTRHRDQHDAGGPTTLTEEEYAELLNYKQELRDWKSGPLPEPPVWL